MKKVLLLSVIALTSCAKKQFENRIQGEWKMSEARTESMDSWHSFPESEPLVTITDSHISNPWNTAYTIVDKTIVFNNQTVSVDVKKHDMLWVFSNNDSIRFTR